MLDNIRRKKDNLIYTAIILATAAVMMFYGVGKMGQSGMDGAAAWVNGDVITRREFQQELGYRMQQYQSLLGGQYDEKFLQALQIPQRTLEELIQYKLLAQQAKSLKILVPDSELAAYIRSVPYYQKDGKFDAELYSKLPNRGLQERQQRERLQVSKFQTYLTDRMKFTPAALKDAYTLRNTKVNLDYVKIDLGALGSGYQPTSSQIDDYLKTSPDKELQAYYDLHQADFTDKAKVELKQIRASVPFKATEEQRIQAKQKIESLAKEVTPASFSEMARAKSDDEYAKKGGQVGWVSRGTLEPQLEAAVGQAPIGKVSGPVETQFGYFLILVTDKKDAVVHPLAEVKRRIASTLLAQKYRSQLAETKHKEWDALLASGKSLDPELKKYKLEMKKTGPFSIGQGSIPGIGQSDALSDAVFEMTPASPMVKRLVPYQSGYYYLKLASVESPKVADFPKDEEVLEKSIGTPVETELVSSWVAKLQKAASVKTEINFQDPRQTEVD